MIVPVANPCQKISMRARFRKFRVSAMMMTPMMVRRILPCPPDRLVPPMTTAAMTSN
jgi:hypothetical protein